MVRQPPADQREPSHRERREVRDARKDASEAADRARNGHRRRGEVSVVVGEFCAGKRDALTPDVRQGHQLYDSTVDSVSDPLIFVVYHDAQAYPEYLIKFTQ